MDRRKFSARVTALAAMAAFACASGAAQKAANEQEQAAPSAAAKAMGYGVRIGGFFTPQHKDVAKKSYAQYWAKNKTCPKDMEREGKTCRALVKGHYWIAGQTLQPAVETFPVPEEVASRLPAAPAGYEYVRAGEDILLMSKAIHLVVDVMQDVVG